MTPTVLYKPHHLLLTPSLAVQKERHRLAPRQPTVLRAPRGGGPRALDRPGGRQEDQGDHGGDRAGAGVAVARDQRLRPQPHPVRHPQRGLPPGGRRHRRRQGRGRRDVRGPG